MGLQEGDTVGGYYIIHLFDPTPQSELYRAYDPIEERIVNIRYFDDVPDLAQKADAILTLEHPNVVPLLNYGQVEGSGYLVYRYIRAATLAEVLSAAPNGKLSLEDALSILQDVGKVLAYAHGQGILHKNIKPSSIVIDGAGKAYLGDFDVGGHVGATAYIPPEQAVAGGDIGAACDIYSLGIVFYLMVTGHLPYDITTSAENISEAHDKLTLPSELEPTIPLKLEEAMLRAFAKKPEDRFQSVDVMLYAFDDTLSGLSADTPAFKKPARLKEIVEEAIADKPDETVTDSTRRTLVRASNPLVSPAIEGGIPKLYIVLGTAVIIAMVLLIVYFALGGG